MILLTTKPDLAWLAEVHLKGQTLPAFKLAAVHGNEDSPSKIELYGKNHLNALCATFEANADGELIQVQS